MQKVTLNQLKPLLTPFKNKYRPYLGQVMIDDNSLNLSNMETFLKIKGNYGQAKGLQKIEHFGLIDSHSDNVEDFPKLDAWYCEEKIICHTRWLENLIPFASKDETRLNLCTIAINEGHFVACDGHTLNSIAFSEELRESYLMPTDSIKILIKALKKFKVKCFEIELNENYYRVDTEYFTFQARTISREYPKWQKVIPVKFNESIQITNWPLFKEIKPVLDKKTYKVTISIDSGKVLLDIPSHKLSFDVGHCDNEDLKMKIGVNASYVKRAVKKEKSFKLLFNGNTAPLMVNGAIVMPIRLDV